MSEHRNEAYSKFRETEKRRLEQIPWLFPPCERRWRNFAAKWYEPDARTERIRVMTKSKRFADSQALDLYHSLTASLLHKPTGAMDKLTLGPRIIASRLCKMAISKNAATSLRVLARLIEAFPLGESIDLENCVAPKWFKPTQQDGLKAVMLGAFFNLNHTGRHPGDNLPTIAQLDRAVKQKFKGCNQSLDKKDVGDKELRNARRELGLSGLPRGKGGRPKK